MLACEGDVYTIVIPVRYCIEPAHPPFQRPKCTQMYELASAPGGKIGDARQLINSGWAVSGCWKDTRAAGRGKSYFDEKNETAV